MFMFVLDFLFLACCCLFAFRGQKAALFKDDDPGKVHFGTVAVLAPGCDAPWCGSPPATDAAAHVRCISKECLSPLSAGFNVKTCCKDTTFC